jgi:hypothetical protein
LTFSIFNKFNSFDDYWRDLSSSKWPPESQENTLIWLRTYRITESLWIGSKFPRNRPFEGLIDLQENDENRPYKVKRAQECVWFALRSNELGFIQEESLAALW